MNELVASFFGRGRGRGQERRRALRRALHVRCRVVRGERVISRRGLDLSLEGMLVASDARVEVGDAVRVSFCLPLTREWIRAVGTVSRVVEGRREGDRERAFAVAWEALDEDTTLFLSEYLRGIPVPLASRAG
jgi:hypothetical protein